MKIYKLLTWKEHKTMKITNSRFREVPEDLANRIQHKNLTRSSIVDEYFPTAITDEAMTNPCVSKEQKKVSMTKIRFGDLKKDDVFEFAGKQMKKLGDNSLHAITLTDRGKESFMFFKHNLVNVENKKPVEINISSSFEVETINYFGMNITSLNPIELETTYIPEPIAKRIVIKDELDCLYAPNIYKTNLGTISYDCNSYDPNKSYESCFSDSIESLLKPINSLSEQGKIFLDVQPVSEDYVQSLLKSYTVKTNSTLSDTDRKSLAMIS